MKNLNIFTVLMMVTVFALVMRIVDIAELPSMQSIAEEKTKNEAPKSAEVKDEKKEALSAMLSNAPTEAEYSQSELDVLQSLSKRRGELDSREQSLSKREALLKATEDEVDKKISELLKIKGEIKDLLVEQDKAQKARIESLVKIYEGMKPQQAARIFNTLDMDILLSVIGKMSERKSSPIIANMDPEKAKKVTVKLAEQHQLPELPPEKKQTAENPLKK